MSRITRRVGSWSRPALAIGIFLAISNIVWEPVSLVIVVVAGGVAWRTTSGLWAKVGLGAAGGALAGMAILGPGFRLAMRVVAIVDPRLVPEFSVGGTMVIIVGVGAIAGGVLGVVGNLMYDVGHRRPPLYSGVVVGMLVVTILLANPGIREELTALGSGLAMNLTMFGAASVLYGVAAMRIMVHLASRTRLSTDMRRSEVRA